MKTFYPTYFVSNESGSLVYIEAKNRKEAVKRYAEIYRVQESSYILTKRAVRTLPVNGYAVYGKGLSTEVAKS